MDNTNNLISVVMSTYNNETTIEKSLLSIFNQTYQNFEILLMDDGSTDNTYELCQKISKNFNRIKIYQNSENIGLTKSLNFLINQSVGNLIARSDADDLNEKNRLEVQLEYLHKNDLDACSTRAYEIGTKRIIPGLSYYIPAKYLINYKNPFIHGTLLIKKEVLKAINLYDESFIYSQDYKLMSDLLKRKYNISIIKEPLYHLNTKNNISTIHSKEQKYYADCVRNNILPIEKV
tara:strand:- start:21207 stop:21908 length:702 start_codon:yes stop_codon:yes gene_type:complete